MGAYSLRGSVLAGRSFSTLRLPALVQLGGYFFTLHLDTENTEKRPETRWTPQ